MRATVPLRTLGTAGDVANACLYLASDMGKFVTGHLLHVNGGEFMV
ncbi:MAG: SDR family oxidoreductase [Mesorhizobium sp.]|nr:MAG: SDR family oxidoreductase [Mesorhizobium sp.]TIV68144.1 MAG: SDR family oxidoreductase [Mesorhizobium sp.]TIW05568.1 MAG: SDR family oxidoreductase [Mesorhizobium sp.]